MVAIDFMLGNVFNIRRQMRLWKRSQGYRYRDFNRQMWVIESGIKYEPIYKDVEFEMKKNSARFERSFFSIEVVLSGLVAPPVVSTWTNLLLADL